MEKKRCFIAVKFPDINEIKETLSLLINKYDVRVKLVDPSLYHFTIFFLGDIVDQQISMIRSNFNTFNLDSFTLGIKNPGSIPPKRLNKTRVLFLEPNIGKGKLSMIQKQIINILEKSGFSAPNRIFLPHLTVARIKGGREIAPFTQEWLSCNFSEFTTQITQVSFVHSTLTSEGPIYKDLYSFS